MAQEGRRPSPIQIVLRQEGTSSCRSLYLGRVRRFAHQRDRGAAVQVAVRVRFGEGVHSAGGEQGVLQSQHLFRTPIGEVEKRLMGSTGVIDAIAETITDGKRLPIYGAEGSSIAKLGKINSIPYLKHCYETLASSSGNFFVYGHSASKNDEHIYQALFKSRINHLYFCIHRPTANLAVIDGELARYSKVFSSPAEYTFVDAETARVWDGP